MATTIVHSAVPRQAPTPPPDTPQLALETSRSASVPIPNKHLPFCPPGAPAPRFDGPSTPPDTPPSKESALHTFSLLRPASSYPKVVDQPPVYSIDAAMLLAACEEMATEPSPDPKHIFPWLHGLHDENQMQLAFFTARRTMQRKTPKCYRGLTIIKAGGDLSVSRLKGSVSPDEVLDLSRESDATFLDLDPKEGFSVRNFQIQVAKIATVSDIVVYRDASVSESAVCELAKKCAIAQSTWTVKSGFVEDEDAPRYHTFVLIDLFEDIENSHSGLVAIGRDGKITDSTRDFFQMERREMCAMGKASEIAHNVWLGPTPDTSLCPAEDEEPVAFDILIEANDLSTPPDTQTLRRIGEESYSSPQVIDFPSSGSILPAPCPMSEEAPLTKMCRWMYQLANEDRDSSGSEDDLSPDSDGNIPMRNLAPTGRKILLHCTDGYTENTLLGMAYFMFAEQIPLHEAWLHLHCEKKRDFFAYPSDVALLQSIESQLAFARLFHGKQDRRESIPQAPAWLSLMDGSLPSRVLPYLYLGNLGHANNPELLKEIGIGQILSVGEPVSWTPAQVEIWGKDNIRDILFIDRVQDNGLDPLLGEFERCLKFIAKGHSAGKATLVHCRVGVSRSATICIAEVMASLNMCLPRAYCYVRARRLNVIIQPHLRFVYELMRWDEILQQRRGLPIRREVEWAGLCREIAGMNRPYCSK